MSKEGGKSGSFWTDWNEETAFHRDQTLANLIDDGLYRLDTEGRFVAVNDVILEQLGYSREDLVGEHVSVLVDDAHVDAVERAIRDLVGADDDVATLEVPVRTAEGQTLYWELRVSLHEVDGEFRGTVGIARDVIDRREWGQPVRNEERLLDRVFEASPIGISALAPDGEIITRNDRAVELVGADSARQVGETYDASEWEVYDDEGEPIPSNEQVFAKVVETGEPVTDVEAKVTRHDDGYVWLSFNGVPVFDKHGGLSMIVITYEDITDRKEHEQDFRRERAQTEQLLQTAPIAILVQNPDGETILANQRAQDTLGLTEQEFLEEPENADEWAIYDADGKKLPPGETPSARVLETGSPVFDQELVIDPPSGERIWVRANAAPLIGADEQIERIIVAGEDITELKKREKQLERSKNELETELSETLGRISDAFYALDEEYRFTHLNERTEEILEYSEGELYGRSAWEVFPEAKAEVFWEAFHTAMDTQEPVSFQYYAEDLDVWLEFNVYPSETGLSIYFQDVTNRVESERRLEESERRYRTLIDHFPHGAVGLFDRDFQYTVVGGQALRELDIPPEEVVGSSIYERYPDDLIEEIEPKFRAVFEGESSEFEIEYHNRDLYVHTLPIETSRGEVFAGMLMVQDITERKEYQRQLEESNERLEQFAYAASHDLQEPLRMVSSYLQLIERRYEDELDEEGHEFLEFAISGADRMRDMVNGLLEYSRVETTGSPLEPLDLDGVVEGALENLTMQIEERDADVTVDPPPTVEGDAGQLRQVFQNLLNNALIYSEAPPEVHISAERDGDEWVVSVRDEGVGIDRENQDRIFEVFQRLGGGENHAGTGIGLALCERIVERHDGEIWVDSVPGEGSTFSFTLPRVQEITDE